MVYPKYSNKQIDQAGKNLIDRSIINKDNDFAVLSNWRAAHAFPLNTMQIYLRRASYKINIETIVVQRLKKLSSILFKLQRFPKMQLSRMQDIGGCRAILSSIKEVNYVYKYFLESRMKHKLVNEKNYINCPKESGYRGIHLVYKYYSDKNAVYNDYQIEIQLRTQMQHMWATTVETIGLFSNQSLKSSMGSKDWLRFFSLVSGLFSIEENATLVPYIPKNRKEILDETNDLIVKLKVYDKLNAYKAVVSELSKRKNKEAKYYLLNLIPSERRTRVTSFFSNQIEEATNKYIELERQSLNTDNEVVLVSSDTIENMEIAYPNYFMDTTKFSQKLKYVLNK